MGQQAIGGGVLVRGGRELEGGATHWAQPHLFPCDDPSLPLRRMKEQVKRKGSPEQQKWCSNPWEGWDKAGLLVLQVPGSGFPPEALSTCSG